MGLPRYNNLPSFKNSGKSWRDYWREVLDLDLITEGFLVDRKAEGYLLILERADTNESILIVKSKSGSIQFCQSHVGAFRRDINREINSKREKVNKNARVDSRFFVRYL